MIIYFETCKLLHDLRTRTHLINNDLHDLREDLDAPKSGLVQTITYMPREVEDFPQVPYYANRAYRVSPETKADSFKLALNEVTFLEKLVMETISMLLSSISVQEAVMSRDQAQLSNQQALRVTKSTRLASIYVPLSFVNGIFVMNLKELNGANLNIWVFLVGTVIAAIVTAVIYRAMDEWLRGKHRRQKD